MRSAAAPRGERGTTVVADRVVRRVAERAAAEAVPEGEPARRVRLQRRGRTVRLALEVRLGYPGRLPLDGDLIRRHVTDRTEELTGLVVPRTRVDITHLRVAPAGGRLTRPVRLTKDAGPSSPEPDARASLPDTGASLPYTGASLPEAEGSATPVRPGPGIPLPHRTRRPWAPRRPSTAVLAAVCAVPAGALLVDVVSVRAGNEPSSWRSSAAERITDVQFGDSRLPWAGAGLAVLGVCLLLLALAPGRRSLLPLRTPERALGAVLDRPSATLLVRDAVLASPGVTGCRVRVGRRSVRVRARVGFGELDAVRDAVVTEVRRVVESLVLSRRPRLRTTVTPDELWRAPESDRAPHSPVPDDAAAGEAHEDADQGATQDAREGADRGTETGSEENPS